MLGDLEEVLEESVPEIERRSSAKSKFRPLQEVNTAPAVSVAERDQWINALFEGFVGSEKNKDYYRVIIETLWPKGHGLPGPHVTRAEIRDAIDNFRKQQHTGDTPYKPYADPFRRVRELAGEEGVIGIAQQGVKYQLVDTTLEQKRVPRTHLSDEEWQNVLKKFNYCCAVCGRQFTKYQPDHCVPRLRGGGDEIENWQPLCSECNIFKSNTCRGCKLDCYKCPWAFPEIYTPLRLSPESTEKIRRRATELAVEPSDLLNRLIDELNI